MKRGRIGDAPSPGQGESFVELVSARGVTIEEIVSSADTPAATYEQDHDEWVMLVEGSATLTVGDVSVAPVDVVALRAGDWLWIPAGVRHTVEEVGEGTRWLAVHLPPG